jgi:serine/threonine protein kinase
MSPSNAQTRTIGGRYRLDRSIGSGGMGTVWEGTDELLGRQVAVKEVRFPPEVGEKEQAELFERTMREARATAQLSHPNVVTTYDVVEEDGRPYIVMELLPTRSLSTVLREDGPLPPHRVAQLGVEMLRGLEASDSLGVVHRAVKPGNVLLTAEGRAVLTDFGIATMAGDPALTSTGVVLGSPSYMSPEQARGKRPGAIADLWSLGATLYAAVEGRPPFDEENALATLTAVVSDPVPTPRVGGPLREAILGLLAKDPDERMDIPTARALLARAAADRSATATTAPVTEAAALDRAGRTEAVPVGAPVRGDGPPPYETYETEYGAKRRRSGPLLAALLVALLLIGGLVAYALSNGGGDDPQADPTPKQSTSKSPSTPTQSASSTPPSSTAEETPQDNGIPAGYQRYEGPTGFSLAVPKGWSASESGTNQVDIQDPNSSRFIRLGWTDQPKKNAKKDWEEQEKSLQAEQPDYQRISIESVDYNGWEAADWEFTIGSVHVRDRGFVPAKDQGNAIYLSTSEDQWADSQEIWQTAVDSFQPAP